MAHYPGNHTDSDLLTVPRRHKTRPGAPQTHLAYITDSEADLLKENKPGTPHGGPHDIPNYDSFDWTGTSFTGGSNQPDIGRDTNRGAGNQGQNQGQNAQQEQRDRQQQEIINRNNANRIAAMNAANQQKPADKWGTQRMAEEKLTTFGGETWGQETPVDYSYSTRDVRATPQERAKFAHDPKFPDDPTKLRSQVQTPAETMARLMAKLTGNPKYLSMPIFVPKGVSYEDQLALLKLAETDPQKFKDTITQFEDITAGNPNVQFQEGFGTGYDEWYTPPALQGGGQNDQGGYSYGYGGQGGSEGSVYGYEGEEDPLERGYKRARFGPGDLMERVNQNLLRLAGLRKKRGGIVSLLRLSR